MNQIAEASKRISALLAGAKQYSQMDRAAYQVADVHELLHSTLMMFGDKVGKDKPIKLDKDWDKSLPEIACYPGDLNEVWTNIIDNAIQAMGGSGTLTIRTWARRRRMIRVEIGDDGPGIPEDIIDRIFTPFFTTKPFGEGTGSAWIWPGGSSSKSITAICVSSRSLATPVSSSCSRSGGAPLPDETSPVAE